MILIGYHKSNMTETIISNIKNDQFPDSLKNIASENETKRIKGL